MQLDWWTLALQAVNFLVLVWLLWRFLYRPVRAVIEKRKALAEQAFASAAKQEAEAEAAQQRFKQGQDQLAQERQDLLKKMHEELEAEREKVLEQAHKEARQLTEEAHAAITEERKAALGEIRGEVARLAVEVASSLLRKAGSEALSDACLQRLEDQLEDMPAEELERLKKDLTAEDARLTVVTATPLTPDAQGLWRSRLAERLGRTDKTGFETDPDIVGGAELRFPHAVLKFTWADQLETARELLDRDESAAR